MKWNELFAILKQADLGFEIDCVFALKNDPIAAVWHYSELDADCEYPAPYNHKEFDGKVYAMRGNSAIKCGLMNCGSGYFDEIARPRQQLGCMCSLQWIYSTRYLPDAMLT